MWTILHIWHPHHERLDSDINSQSQNWTETKQITTTLGETTQLMDQADRHTPVTLSPPPTVCVHRWDLGLANQARSAGQQAPRDLPTCLPSARYEHTSSRLTFSTGAGDWTTYRWSQACTVSTLPTEPAPHPVALSLSVRRWSQSCCSSQPWCHLLYDPK